MANQSKKVFAVVLESIIPIDVCYSTMEGWTIQ